MRPSGVISYSTATGDTGIDSLLQRMARDEFDLIAVGRALLSDPQWVSKVQRQETGELKGFDPASLGELV